MKAASLQRLNKLETQAKTGNQQTIDEIIATSPDGKITASIWRRCIDAKQPIYPDIELDSISPEQAEAAYREFMQ